MGYWGLGVLGIGRSHQPITPLAHRPVSRIPSSIPVKLAQIKHVAGEANVLRLFAVVVEHHFHDIEAKVEPRTAEPTQVIQRGTAHMVALVLLYRFDGTTELLGDACLHLHENQYIFFTSNQVDVTTATLRTIPADEDLVTVLSQVRLGDFLSPFTADQMLGLFSFAATHGSGE